jgi:hypothetical protein
MGKTSSLQPISPILQEIARQAESYPEMVFTTLWHMIDVEWLRVAYTLTRKDGASGVDKVTAAAYAGQLEDTLANLHQRLREGR